MRKKGIPDVLVRLVMSLYEGANTRVRVNFVLSDEFHVKIDVQKGSVLSPFLLAVMVDVVTELIREGSPSELLYGDDIVLTSETIKGLGNKFIKWKEAFESMKERKKKEENFISITCYMFISIHL